MIHCAAVSGADGETNSGIMVEYPDTELQNAVRDVMDARVRLSTVGFFLAVPPEWQTST